MGIRLLDGPPAVRPRRTDFCGVIDLARPTTGDWRPNDLSLRENDSRERPASDRDPCRRQPHGSGRHGPASASGRGGPQLCRPNRPTLRRLPCRVLRPTIDQFRSRFQVVRLCRQQREGDAAAGVGHGDHLVYPYRRRPESAAGSVDRTQRQYFPGPGFVVLCRGHHSRSDGSLRPSDL